MLHLSFDSKKALSGAILLSGILCGGAALVPARMVDDADISSGFVAQSEKGAADTVAILAGGEAGQAVQLKYNFATAGDWLQVKKDFSKFNFAPLHVADTKIRFYYRLTGLLNTLLFRLTDANGVQVLKRWTSPVNDGSWQEAVVPITELTGFGSFDLYNVSKVEIALEKNAGGSGTLDIDKMELVRSSETSGQSLLLDNFDGGTGSNNQFGGAIGTFANDSAASISTTYDNTPGNVHSGAYSLKLTYNAGSAASVENALYFNSPNGQDLRNYRQIEFYAKASNDNEAFTLDFGSKTVRQKIIIGGIGKDWRKVTIPFENYSTLQNSGANGGIGFSKVTEFVVIFTPAVSAGKGDLWLDDIRFVRNESAASVLRSVDDFEENTNPGLTNWETAADQTGSASLLSLSGGYSGRALRMTYSFNQGGWCTLTRNFYVNATLFDAFRFRYKATGGANNFEFHVLNAGDVHFYYKAAGGLDTGGEWKTLTIPFKELFSSSGGNTFDFRKINEMRFTFLKGAGGKGTFTIDNFEVVNSPKAALEDPSALIQSLAIDNNPFSPNGDGLKDQVTFSYVLREESFIRLRIYDSGGMVIKEYKLSDPVPAGSGAMLWDGTDSNGNLVNNGLYFFSLSAESTVTGTKDKAANVVVALR